MSYSLFLLSSPLLRTILQENILFGEPYDEVRFNRALRAASLEDDIKVLPGGVMTEIGNYDIKLRW